jgi:hypothetical protein
MGTLFSFLTVRIALIVMGLVSISITVATAIAGNQPPFDPFAPYADIMPGQSRETVLQRGFHCQFNEPPYTSGEFCSLTPETGIFSAIQVSIVYNRSRVSRVVFIAREPRLVLGHLAWLWGKPQTKMSGQTVNFRWPNQHIVTVLQNYNGHFSYWLPITYVAFEVAK